jgi:hypothetical protein
LKSQVVSDFEPFFNPPVYMISIQKIEADVKFLEIEKEGI